MNIIVALDIACDNKKVVTIQADWRGEFRNKEFEDELKQ